MFLAVASAAYFVAQLLTNREGKQIRNRLSAQQQSRVARSRAPGFLPLLQRIGQAAAEPFMPKSREKQSGLRQNLARAGIYAPAAVRVMAGSKVILMFAGVAGGRACQSGSRSRIRAIVSETVSPLNGFRPESISYRRHPKDQTSLRLSTGLPRACSGLM